MKINWTVRIKNKTFWVTIIPAVLLLVQAVASVFGFTIDLGDLGEKLLTVVNAVFGVLVVLGVTNDPTTAGTSDSAQALTYVAPKKQFLKKGSVITTGPFLFLSNNSKWIKTLFRACHIPYYRRIPINLGGIQDEKHQVLRVYTSWADFREVCKQSSEMLIKVIRNIY